MITDYNHYIIASDYEVENMEPSLANFWWLQYQSDMNRLQDEHPDSRQPTFHCYLANQYATDPNQ